MYWACGMFPMETDLRWQVADTVRGAPPAAAAAAAREGVASCGGGGRWVIWRERGRRAAPRAVTETVRPT